MIICIVDASCLNLLIKVFAKPVEDQPDEIFFYAMMFLVLACGAGITMFLTVCLSVMVDYYIAVWLYCLLNLLVVSSLNGNM